MAEPEKRRVIISYDETKVKKMILPTITVGELIKQAHGWFKLEGEIANSVLELEGNNLDPEKSVEEYSSKIFACPCKLRTLSPITYSVNSSEEKVLTIDLNLELSEVAKKVLSENCNVYYIEINGKMINPNTKLRDLQNLEEDILEFFTENIEVITVKIHENGNNWSEEKHPVNKLSTFKAITDYVVGMRKLDPKFYSPTIPGVTIEGSKTLKDVPNVTAYVIEFKRTEDSPNQENENSKQSEEQTKNVRLKVCFQDSVYTLKISPHQTFEEVIKDCQNVIPEKNAELEYYHADRKLDNATFDELLKNLNGKELRIHCCKIVEIQVKPDEIVASKLDLKPVKVSIQVQASIQNLKDKVAEALKLKPRQLSFCWKEDEIKDKLSIEEFMEKFQSNEIKLTILSELTFNWEASTIVKIFQPTMTIESVMKNLEIPKMDKKRLVYKGKALSLNSTLNDNELFGTGHIIDIQPKPSVIVEYMQDSFEFTLEQNSTTEDLQSAVTKFSGLNSFEQLIIVVKEGVENCTLSTYQKKLSDLIDFENCRNYKVVVKIKTPTLLLLCGSNENHCFGLAAREPILFQKKIVALGCQMPFDKQEWIILNNDGTFTILDDNKTIESYNIGKDKIITVAKKLTLYLCMAAEPIEVPNILSIDLIKNAKKRVEKIIEISQKEQQWVYQEKEMVDDKCFEVYAKDKYELAIDVIYIFDLEYFGFGEASPINSDLFTNFYLESDQELTNVVEQTDFKNEGGAIQFRNKTLPIFFAVLKKHAHWESLIEEIRHRVYKKKLIKLWNSHHFNAEYLLSYILNTQIPKLNFSVLTLLKQHIPVPLTVRPWKKRHELGKPEVLNDIYWLVQPSYTISSIGLGDKVKGKSSLNNMLFFTNFLEEHQRNAVCEGLTEIKFDIYRNEKIFVNFVEIGDQTDEQVKKDIIKSSNLLVVHSTLMNESLHNTLNRFRKEADPIPVILFHRDVNNAFDTPAIFTENLLKQFEASKQSKVFEVDVENLAKASSTKNMNEIKIIRDFVHNYIMMNFKKSSPEDLWKFANFFDGYNGSALKKIFTSIEKSSSKLCNATETFYKFTSIQRDNSRTSEKKEQESEVLIEELKKRGLTPELQELISFIYSSQLVQKSSKCLESPSLILTKLQNFLRNMKIKQTMDFYKLYTFRSDLSTKEISDPKVEIERFAKYWDAIKDKTSYFKGFQPPSNEPVKKILEFITKCIDIFEQNIVPEIFSMELLWREMIYMTSLVPTLQIPYGSSQFQSTINLEQVLIDLSKSRIQDGFPFEIIDGDLLHMPKEFLKKVFGGDKDNAVVISVLGPQSSGKSTLLNFLFGCDFSTSAGRCTKGIYGTFLKLSNFNACGGVLLLDTEGLFGLLNKAENSQRDKFDRKLVLFCLAISDFVLVNFRGDIDKTLSDLLMITLQDSLIKLQQGNTILPEMMLILNQNAQTDKEHHLRDINKMTEYGFTVDNVTVLPLAFDTEEIQMEALVDPIIKKDPKSDFSKKCRNITDKIFHKITTRQVKQRTLENIFDTMEKIWETMSRYPSLLKHGTLKDKEIEEAMRNWVNEKIVNKWREQLSDQFLKYKSEDKVDRLANEINLQEDKLKDEFDHIFEKVRENHALIFKEQKDYLQQHLNLVKKDIDFEINKVSHSKKIKICNIEGEEHIKQAIREAKNNPNMDKESKEKLFEETWSKVESGALYTFNRKEENKILFDTIYEKYQISLINLTGGLPQRMLASLDYNSSYSQYQANMRTKIEQMYSQGGLEESKGVPSKVLNGGIGNVSFRYFDMKKYFYQANDTELFVISRNVLHEILNLDKIRTQLTTLLVDSLEVRIQSIVTEINRTFDRFGFTLDQEYLRQYIEYNIKTLWTRIIGFFQQGEPKPPSKTKGFPKILWESLPKSTYVDTEKLSRAIKNHVWYEKSTITQFIKNAIGCIMVDDIKNSLKDVGQQNHQHLRIEEIIDSINQDLVKINCQLQTSPSRFLDGMHSKDMKSLIWDFVTINGELRCDPQEFKQLNFAYLHKNPFLAQITKIKPENYSKNNYLLLGVSSAKIYQVKPEYSSINWLHYYAKHDFCGIAHHSSQNKSLLQFVSEEFNLNKLLLDIFKCCDDHLNGKSQESCNSLNLYINISRDINNLIGLANNDLQQACYKLDFNISATIHLSVVELIWKHFEEANWNRINQPLKEMRDQKEKQKNFFMAMTSQDGMNIARVEVESFAEKIITYYKNEFLAQIKTKLIKRLAEKFNIEGKRDRVQREMDERYFSRGAMVNLDDLYRYICDPYEVLETHYRELISKYVKEIEIEYSKEAQVIKSLMGTLNERIVSIFVAFNEHLDSTFDTFNLYRPIQEQTQNLQSNEVFYQTYEEKLRTVNFEMLLKLLRGDPDVFNRKYKLEYNISVEVNPSDKFCTLPLLNEPEIFKLINHLEKNCCGISNLLNFLKVLLDEVESITKKLLGVKVNDEEIEHFRNLINFYVCKQKCPCCDRICGEDDPNHKYHQVKYGHQMRAIGGIKLNDNSASVSRCEDIGANEIMQYNGVEKTWMEFKEEMRNHPNNPWIYDDLEMTKHDKTLEDKFKYVWKQVGEIVCKDRYKGDMTYVEYNPANLRSQKIIQAPQKVYIFIIDSSSSMQGRKWSELLEALKQNLGVVHSQNKNNKVTIINFSSRAMVEYSNMPANKIPVDSLTFQSGGTDFEAALQAGLKEMQKDTQERYSVIFLSDGECLYPNTAISKIQKHVATLSSEQFEFTGLEFQCKCDSIKQMCTALNGKSVFVADGAKLQSAFYEIITKKI